MWNESGKISFNSNGNTGSSISDAGGETIIVETIDNIIDGENVGFIKMDIEGAELRALQGAAETIKNNKPTLAICVYHRAEDLITIPQFIKNIHSDYKFYLRKHWHYVSLYELVFYAIPV